MEENLKQFSETYNQGLGIAASILTVLAILRLFLVIKNRSERNWIFNVKGEWFVKLLKIYFLTGLLAFLADIPVWFMAVSYYRPIAQAYSNNLLIAALLYITLQELILCFTVSKSLINQFIKRILFFMVSIFCASCFLMASIIAPATYRYPDELECSKIDLPVHGTWLAMQAGEGKWVNYHNNFAPQKFAVDMVKLNENERFFENNGTDTSDFISFGDSIFSPIDGIVFKTIDGLPTQKIFHGEDSINPAGNYIEINFENGRYLFLAHLKSGSIIVHQGDQLRKGQFIALSGNSGNTSYPHLHIHIQNKPLLNDTLARGLPFRFLTLERKRFLSWNRIENADLLRNDKFRN